MQEEPEGPILLIEVLLFVLRCLIPLLLMLGVSYLLKRLGLITPPPAPTHEQEEEGGESYDEDDEAAGEEEAAEGGAAHAKA